MPRIKWDLPLLEKVHILLQQAGQRLLSLVREEDTVARLGGDEFQITGAAISSKDQVSHLADRLLQDFSSPFKIETHEVNVTLSINRLIYPQDGKDTVTLIKNADVALYQAKIQGKNKYAFFPGE